MSERLYRTFSQCKSFAFSHADKLKCACFAFAFGITPIGGIYPFGIAFFIACDKYTGLLAFVNALCCLMNGNAVTGALISVGIYAFKKLLTNSRRPLINAFAGLCAAMLLCFASADGVYSLAKGIICASFLPLFTLLYGLFYTQKRGSSAHYAAVCAFLFTAVLFFKSVLPFYVPCRVAALLITIFAAAEGGMLYGGFTGFVCGLACDSATAAMLGVCGLSGGLLYTVGEYLALPVGCLAGLCVGLYFLGAGKVPMLIICFALAAVLRLVLKNKISLFFKGVEKGEDKQSLKKSPPLSEAFFAISQSARVAAGGDSGAVRAADDYESFSQLLKDETKRQGEDEETDEKLTQSVGVVLSGAGVRAESIRVTGKRKKRLEADNVMIDALTVSPDNLCRLVSKVTNSNMSVPEFYIKNGKAALYMESVPRYRIECARTGVCKRGERISGDTVSFFKGKDGMFFALISDGMGSGSEAATSSRTASVFLEKLLSAGASTSTALALLNSYLASRESEIFATVDLFEADLYTGKGSLVKAGAAPSFVVRGGKCRRLQSATAPAGIIRELRAEQLNFSLKHGDMLVMLSDGISDDGAEAEKAISSLNYCQNTAEMANALISNAVRKNGKKDDMSVCVIKVLDAA